MSAPQVPPTPGRVRTRRTVGGSCPRQDNRRSRRGGWSCLVALLLAVLSLAPASGASASTETPKPQTTFTVGLLNEVDSFNPFVGIEAESLELWGLMYDYMISFSMTDMSPTPALATGWTTSPDGLTWTFTIRTGVTWSDGQPLTAHDIAYTYRRILTGETEGATWKSYLTGVTAVEAPDDTHVVLTLEKPNAVLPLLPIPIMAEHVWRSVSEKAVKSYAAEPKGGQSVVGSGPYRLVEGTAGGSTYRLVANPDYWGGRPHVDQVVFRVYKSEDPMVQALIKGEIDFAEGISALQVKALTGKPGITAHNGDSPGFDEIAFNAGSVDTKTGRPIGDPSPAVLDPRFRHALGYAIDRNLLVKKVYQGAGVPGTTIIPPGYAGYHWEPPSADAFTFDLAKADRLLTEAGYPKGPDGKRRLPDGKPLGTLRLAARTEASTSVDSMSYLKEWLGELGIDSKVETYETSKLTDVILAGTFDLFQWSWFVEPDPDSMLSYLTCGQRGDWSDSWYCNKAYDALYAQQHSETDHARREEQVRRMQQILYEDSPYLVTAYKSIGEAVRSDRFACFQAQPDPGGVWLVQYGVHNYKSVRPAAQSGDCDGATTALGASMAAATQTPGPGLWYGVAGTGVGAVLLGGFFALRRRSGLGDRE